MSKVNTKRLEAFRHTWQDNWL